MTRKAACNRIQLYTVFFDREFTQMGLHRDCRLEETLNTTFDRRMIQARFQRFGALKAKGHLKEIQLRACSYVFYQDKGRQIKL